MDIQQTDKESLAAYVHRFKWKLTDVSSIMTPPP